MFRVSYLGVPLLCPHETVDIDAAVVRDVSKLYPMLRQAIRGYKNELRGHVLVCEP
jgi:hypothetical protein